VPNKKRLLYYQKAESIWRTKKQAVGLSIIIIELPKLLFLLVV
jgi:hypothetical protein